MITTTLAPAPGISWQAVIISNFEVAVIPALHASSDPIPGRVLSLVLTPSLTMQPPVGFSLIFEPSLIMSAGSKEEASLNLEFDVSFGWTPDTAYGLRITPSVSFEAAAVIYGKQLNVAVSRSSTI